MDVTDSVSKIVDSSVIGALLILVLSGWVFREIKHWPNQIKETAESWKQRYEQLKTNVFSEIKEERAKHDKTRDLLIAEIKSNGETMQLVMKQMSTQQASIDALLSSFRRGP